MADYIVKDTELTSVANAIRTAGGTNSLLSFPNEFVSAVNNISGGGSSDFSTAVLTFVLSEGKSAQFACANFEIQGDEGMALGENGAFNGGRTTFDVILCKGSTMLTLTNYPSGSNISISGNIEDMGRDTYLITGDCTITIS